MLSGLLEDPEARALYLYPTKALAQDQLRVLQRYMGPKGIRFEAGTYDGDTPASSRRKLREEAKVLLTNPDMLHSGILPNHAKWANFLSRLQYVVIDEIHTYRGIFGSHIANVMRRLDRICGALRRAPGLRGLIRDDRQSRRARGEAARARRDQGRRRGRLARAGASSSSSGIPRRSTSARWRGGARTSRPRTS